MIENALLANYVIDGVSMEFTPDEILNELIYTRKAQSPQGQVIDESLDPKPLEPIDNQDYLSLDLSFSDTISLANSAFHTKLFIAQTLLELLLKEGSFRLQDLSISLNWKWNSEPVGAMSAFYFSVQSAAEYIDNLNIKLEDYTYTESNENKLEIVCKYNILKTIVPQEFEADTRSWIVYIPFDTADYRLGGSSLAQNLGLGGAVPNINDADYFIDCYEVVREFVEDGLLLSAAVVGQGGLWTSLKKMKGECGLKVDISDILNAYNEKSSIRVLMSEIPGIVLQIRNSDFDYIDAQFLLQDVAYYPIGHPDESGDIQLITESKNNIQTILESLIQNYD